LTDFVQHVFAADRQTETEIMEILGYIETEQK